MEADSLNTSHESPQPKGTNPLIALGVIIIIAITMVSVTFVIFIKSNAFQTVKQIKAGTMVTSKNDLDGYDITSPIKSNEFDKLNSNLSEELKTLDDESDFGQNAINDQNLGL